ncbi:MAG: hypothetical protein SVT56_01155 [Chloroflexota bacterium]|jgi:hypothetical protein|nr:hypothetical protein [Chloroflexota bacterium]
MKCFSSSGGTNVILCHPQYPLGGKTNRVLECRLALFTKPHHPRDLIPSSNSIFYSFGAALLNLDEP